LGGRVAVQIRQHHQAHDRPDRNQDAGDQRVDVREQLLEADEVPRGLGRLGGELGLARPRSGAAKAPPRLSTAAAVARPTTAWRTSRWGQVNTLSSGRRSSAVTDWRATTPSRRTRRSPSPPAPPAGIAAGTRGRSVACSENAPLVGCWTAKPSLRTRQICRASSTV